MMKRALAVILAAGFAVGSYATDARVAVMGRQGTPYFYRDEVSVFVNPADMSLYPNLIYGSFGWLNPVDRSADFFMQNSTPNDPFFGGMVSYSFSDEENGPMLSIGAFLNRKDYMLDRLINGTRAKQVDGNGDPVNGADGRQELGPKLLKDPAGKMDLMFGYDIGNGLAFGLGTYMAYYSDKLNTELRNETGIYKFTGGINYNIEQGLDLEVAVNYGITTGKYSAGPTDAVLEISDGDYFLRGDVRFFSAVPAINGSFVPQVSLEYINMANTKTTDLAGGVGLNMNIDRGFFWAGLQGIYTQTDVAAGDNSQSIGGRLSFGIERNVVWDWFLIRVGGQKEFRYESNADVSSRWTENPESNGWDNDLVGLGFGINIDNRLRIDFVASEDLPYTFTNLISGSAHHLFNRVSATYRF